jgi:uracil-DNA glycosylase family 4
MEALLKEIRVCKVCKKDLKHGARPVVTASKYSKIALIGQAPGISVHNSGIPWNDPSGVRLRSWLNMDEKAFYDTNNLALIPMGFCYPGKGKTGDLPPRKECAPLWHEKIFNKIDKLQLILLVGAYAQNYYLGKQKKKSLTETVQSFYEYLPKFFPLPHPSPRNNIWMKKNPWFEEEVLKELKQIVRQILENT